MENKLNIAELLKDCPKGMELDCTMYEGAELYSVTNNECYPIRIIIKDDINGNLEISLTKEGYYNVYHNPKCVIFPKGKTTWEGFVPPCKFKDGDIIVDSFGGIHIMQNSTISYCYFDRLGILDRTKTTCVRVERLATEEEKQKLFDAIKANGYKWNEATKTLEKLVQPKFHEGEWLCVNKPNDYAHLVKIIKVVEVFGKKRYTISRDYNFDLDVVECDFIEKNYHLWTIEDAKDGDVLFHSDSASNGVFIFKEILQHGTIQKVTCYCDYDSEDGFCLGENHTCCWTDSKILHPATKEQYNLLFRNIKKAGYKWDKETKTLKKVEPKFKVGDRIKSKELNLEIRTITKVYETCYEFDNGWTLKLGCQDEWELVSNKFDISTLKPFDKVLVRDCNKDKWNIDFFSYYRDSDDYQCMTFVKNQCIPYEGNEHLLGKSDKCDDFYITW